MWFVIVVIIILIGWMIFRKPATNMGMQDTSSTTATSQTQTSASSTEGSQVANPNDTSNASLNADASNIDAQLNGLQSDGSNTTPVAGQ